MTNDIMPFDSLNEESTSIIKVIGVGGGGGNAVNHMYKEGIEGVTFALCNTDNQALARSPIPVKLQLGPTITHGLGAGNRPEKAKEAAEESVEDIRKLLNDGTQMVFITAGMGGGTGTGAAPVMARIAKEMGILTIGIVTIPFLFEGKEKIIQAIEGVEAIKQNVDALMIINNERLRSIYADLTFINAFTKADDTLSIAARSIVEIITTRGYINLDFSDVKTTLKDGGVAIISTGVGEGENRVEKAIQDALNSPLLNNTDIVHAQKVLLNISISEKNNFLMDEINGIHEFMHSINPDVTVIWGCDLDNSLENKVKITLLASGFDVKDVAGEDAINIIEQENEEIEQSKLEKIAKVYGDLIENSKRSKKYHIYIFSPDDLDNDDIIFNVEESPTYSRDKITLKKIASQPTASKQEEKNEAAAMPTNGAITF